MAAGRNPFSWSGRWVTPRGGLIINDRQIIKAIIEDSIGGQISRSVIPSEIRRLQHSNAVGSKEAASLLRKLRPRIGSARKDASGVYVIQSYSDFFSANREHYAHFVQSVIEKKGLNVTNTEFSKTVRQLLFREYKATIAHESAHRVFSGFGWDSTRLGKNLPRPVYGNVKKYIQSVKGLIESGRASKSNVMTEIMAYSLDTRRHIEYIRRSMHDPKMTLLNQSTVEMLRQSFGKKQIERFFNISETIGTTRFKSTLSANTIHGLSTGKMARILKRIFTAFGSPWRGLETGILKLAKELTMFHGATYIKSEGLFSSFMKPGMSRAGGRHFTFGPGIYFTELAESARVHARATLNTFSKQGSLVEREQKLLKLKLPKKTTIFNLGSGESSKEFGQLLETAFEKRFGTKVPFSSLTGRFSRNFDDAASVYNEARESLTGLFQRMNEETSFVTAPVTGIMDEMERLSKLDKNWADTLINDTLRSHGVQGITYNATHTNYDSMEAIIFNERLFDHQLKASNRSKVIADQVRAVSLTHSAQPHGTPAGIAKSLFGDRGARQMPSGGNG